ncbi:MAG TPA: BatA domain-containing protein, partial [Paracoccaceae bacterium]|nr:BatA domain-containing protein [Paracoccaceae bacterium]
MLTVGSLAFLNPWLLAGLAGLPVLWWLMRAIPPSPKRQVFAGVRLLKGLEDDERQTDRTPWWLLLLRCLVVAAALVGFAQPVQNLNARIGGGGGPLLVLMDQGWASAPDWAERSAAAREILNEAEQAERQVLFWPMAEPGEAPPLVSA